LDDTGCNNGSAAAGTKPTNSTWRAENTGREKAGHKFEVVLLLLLLLILSFITPAPQ